MGGGGGGKSQTQSSGSSTQISKVELPPWVDKAGQENVAEAGPHRGAAVSALRGHADPRVQPDDG